MKKILFCDVDGVLFTFRNYEFSAAAFKNLNLLLEKEPQLKIVISSSWRELGLEHVKNVFKAHGVNPKRIIDATGEEGGKDGKRGIQVQAWLDRNPEVTHFVCIDDDADFANMKDHLVQTNPMVGITEADVRNSLDILKKAM